LPRGAAGRATISRRGRLRYRRQRPHGGVALSRRHLLDAVASMELLARRRGLHRSFVAPLPSRSRLASDGGAHRGSHVLHAGAGLVRPARVEWQPPTRLSRHRDLLRRLPDPPRVIWAALGLVALIAIALRAVGVEQMPALQNVYLVPVLWAALARGTLGGILAGLVAGLVQSLSIFPFVELVGLSWPALGALLALWTPLTLGLSVGRLVDRARGRGAQLDALLSIQRSLADSALLTERLATVAELTRAALEVDRVRLVLETGHDASVAASAPQSYRPPERGPRAGATPGRRLALRLDAGPGPPRA